MASNNTATEIKIPHGAFHWNELMTDSADQAKAFYADTVGWSFDAMNMPTGGTYWVAKVGERPVAGIFPMAGKEFKDIPNHWFAYIAVDDVDARVKKAQSAGATLVKPAFEVPGVGKIAILKQPDGAMIGWMTPANGTA